MCKLQFVKFSTKWKHFERNGDFLVATADKIFDILADVTRNTEQSTLDDYKKVGQKSFGYKNTNGQTKDSNISIGYEEEKDPDEEEFKTLELGYKHNKKLNEVNEDNLDQWVDILKAAVKDLTVLSKTNSGMRMNIEDLSQAMATIYRINNRMYKGNIRKGSIRTRDTSTNSPRRN